MGGCQVHDSEFFHLKNEFGDFVPVKKYSRGGVVYHKRKKETVRDFQERLASECAGSGYCCFFQVK